MMSVKTSSTSARDRLVAAARRHFFAHGFRSVTMDDLAESLGMSKKTVYKLFPSKTALLQAVLESKFEHVRGDLEQASAESAGTRDVQGALAGLVAVIHRHAEEFHPSFVRDMRRDAPDLFEVVQKRRAEMIRHYFGRALRDAQKGGVVRNDIPHNAIIAILLGAMQSVVNPTTLAELSLTAQEGFSAVMNVFLQGVLTPQARKNQ
jgi:AcrR family transcriptional regulator